MTEAEWNGYCAFQNGYDRSMNPFVLGPEAVQWDNGWLKAEREEEEEDTEQRGE